MLMKKRILHFDNELQKLYMRRMAIDIIWNC